ncbi:MAG: hypothetical protein ABIJ12_03650, partial [bacterium]
RLKKEPEEDRQALLMRLFDILFIDFYFDELNDRFLNWVIERHADQFSQSELREMRAESESHLDFYEVQKVFPGDGCIIKSLFTNNEGFLKDVSSSFNMVKWDIVLARCYLLQGNYHATGSLTRFEPPDKRYITNRIKKVWLGDDDLPGNQDYADFAKNHWDIFYQIEREIREKAKNKKFYTKYGELHLCEVRFQVGNLKAVLGKIDSLDEFNFIETKMRRDTVRKKNILRYQFDWFTLGIEEELEQIRTGDIDNGIMISTAQLDIDGNQTGIDVIGNLFIDQFLFRLEIRSLELAEFAVRHFTALFGDTLVFKRIIKMKSSTDLLKEAGKRQKETSNANQQLENSELRQKVEKDIYLKLLDEKIPMLNNMSPREARKNPVGLPLLIDWLKGMENQFEQDRKTGKTTAILDLIKKELNIDLEYTG